MKLKESVDVKAFLDAARECLGDVFFQTAEGDILNLKSLLSQYVLMSVLGNQNLLKNGQIVCMQESDYEKLGDYLTPSEESESRPPLF